MQVGTPYPVALNAELAPQISRWLWLIKWVLIIPHLIVLAVLWLVAVVLTLVALFAILFTGRYPRGIFDYNVGLLLWTWRVGFYSYSALGTDRYPPFSLRASDYPATLEIEYPERLHRGLVLVKWVLAIPQFIIVGFFQGGIGERFGGLIGVLAIFAGVALLFTGRYPVDIFRFLIAMNRWTFRVTAYALLMRDEYPPFRLDFEEPARA